jgi:chemotaxis protein MotB
MALARARRDSGMNYWPGFVDALSTLILGIIFLLTVFVLVQFYLTQEVTGKDTALNRLNAQIAQLTELLSLEKTGKLGLEEQLSMLRSSLTALAQRVQELSRYRSDFFGRLRAILGNRPDIRIVGDRFVFQSEVFFDTAKASLDNPEGRAELDGLATALLELEKKIPGEIPWVLRVDGHTDVRGINSPQFKNNWELSVARAISVVQYLVGKGVSPQRLVAAGFGEFQPIDTDKTEEAFSRNRRIELKLTER